MDAANLIQIALFDGLSDAQLKQISGWADEIDVDTGYHLIRRDGFGYEFFAIIDGTAEVMDGERHLADLSAGDVADAADGDDAAGVPLDDRGGAGARRADPREGRRAARQQRALAHEPTRPAVALRRARCEWPKRTHR